MPDIPEDIYRAAEKAIRDEVRGSREWEPGRLAEVVVDKVAPLLAARIAGKIGAHGPSGTVGIDNRAQIRVRRHLDIAARIAASAFSTEDEIKRAAAQALAAGNYVACDIPEPGE